MISFLQFSRWTIAVTACAVVVAPSRASGQASAVEDSGPADRASKALDAYRLAVGEQPRLDGMLDEPVWQAAPVATGFVQFAPAPGEPPSERTEVHVLYDDDAVYVGAQMFDRAPDSIVGRLARRDEAVFSDWFWVMIDGYWDRRTAFAFGVNPKGVEQDVFLFDDTGRDQAWDAVWDVAARRTADGWIAEFRIPLSQLRFGTHDELRWGVNFRREIARRGEVVDWAAVPPRANVFVSTFGQLRGQTGVRPRRRIEVLPYVVGQVTRAPGGPTDPFFSPNRVAQHVGADLRYGLTPELTLSATINPDFGQVEADPSVVNLSAFESFFQERRPFFVEGAEFFRLAHPGFPPVVHSRRIGRQPQGSTPSDAEYRGPQPTTTILGAAKLTGKTGDGWSIGLLDAVTDAEQREFASGGSIASVPVEPLTNYAVVRVAKDFQSGASSFGGIFTATNRQITDPELSFLHDGAYVAGLDGRFRVGQSVELAGSVVGSHVRGSPEAITRTQRSPIRRFDRVGAGHLTFDPTRTSLSGVAGTVRLRSMGSGTWSWNVNGYARTPGYEIGDLGFQFQDGADSWGGFGSVAFRRFQPGPVFREWSVSGGAWMNRTFGGETWSSGISGSFDFTLRSLWGGVVNVWREIPSESPEALRGGPTLRQPGWVGTFVSVFSDRRKPVSIGMMGDGTVSDEQDGWSFAASPTLQIRPSNAASISIGPRLRRAVRPTQYVDAVSVAGSSKYVVGRLDQTTASFTARVDYTFTPTLSLQVYAQPFISAGRYDTYRVLQDPTAHRLDERFRVLAGEAVSDEVDEGIVMFDTDGDGVLESRVGRPDFSLKQFRSNVVLRWEYRSGSALFVVWNQNRDEGLGDGSFALGRDVARLFRAVGTNTVMVKMSYWLGT